MKKEDLKEVKKGTTGTGLLIENDGYICLDEGKNKVIKEAIESANGWYCPYPFKVSAVFQKYDTKNANGRIYPRDILIKEVANYQRLIDQKMALGECYTPDVLILCEEGWKCIADVTDNDKVLTLNTETNDIEIKKVDKKIELDFEGELIHLESKNISESVTPNHGYPIFNGREKFDNFYTASEIFENKVNKHNYIPKQGNWNVKGEEYFVLKGIENPSKKTLQSHPDCKEDKLIPMSTFMKFMGIYLSEGDYRKNNNDVIIYQVKIENCLLIEELINELDLNYTIEINKKGRHTFRICDPRLNQYLRPLGDCYAKYIPVELKQQSKENLKHLYDWFVLGDGRIRGDKRRKGTNLTDDVFSVSKQLVLDLNEIQLKIGYSGNYHVEDRLIEGKNCSDMYFSLRSLTKGVYLDERFLKTSKVPYTGKVMCIEVPNHTFYVMSNGKCHWSKNCNHPSESTIDLSRVSHNITELHWEGKTLIGDLELNVSQGFVNQGIVSTCGDQVANLILNGYKIGVSSRAVGSVENKNGVLMVGDDLEIICWDVVATPSTPGSYIASSQEKLQQYVESENKEGNLLSEKISKLKNILK